MIRRKKFRGIEQGARVRARHKLGYIYIVIQDGMKCAFELPSFLQPILSAWFHLAIIVRSVGEVTNAGPKGDTG